MRYFMITYAYKDVYGGGYGHHFFEQEKHPSISELEHILKQKVIIMNIQEFKNKEDYKNVQG